MSLQKLVTQYAAISSIYGSWQSVLCPVCHDHGRKGKRAAFIFDVNTVGYHCFNCGIKATHTTGITLSQQMISVLHAFNIPPLEITKLRLGMVAPAPCKQKTSDNSPPTILLPPRFYPLDVTDSDDMWAILAVNYLTDRGVDPSSQPFYLAKSNNSKYDKWYGRLIIPYYHKNNLIFYQGRDLVGTRLRKYENAPTPISKVMYGYDKLKTDLDKPLFVTEGFFNAAVIGGVGVFTNTLSKEQILQLNASTRKIVIIPDRTGNGKKLAIQGIKEDWYVAIPKIHDCDDINSAIARFGKWYVLDSIRNNIISGSSATIHINLFCK